MTVDKSAERIRRMFGEISERYDFLNHFLSGGVDYYWRWRTIRTAPPRGEAPILDVCTGTGDLAIAYWNRSARKIAVYGTDFTHEMLTLATRKVVPRSSSANGAPETRLTFVEADTQQLPFAEGLFQIVSVAFGLRNVSDTLGGLREMVRVCQPGGRVVVLEFSLPANAAFRAIYQWYFRNVLPRIGQFLARNQQAAYNYLPQSVAEFPQGETLAAIMRKAGLTDITWTPLTFGIATLYVGRKPDLAGR